MRYVMDELSFTILVAFEFLAGIAGFTRSLPDTVNKPEKRISEILDA